MEIQPTRNYLKHHTKNPIQKLLIENFYRVLLKEIKGAAPLKILDIGCGEGFTLKRLKDKNIGELAEGIDVLVDAVELGKKVHPDLNLKIGDIYELPYKENSFDLVICTQVLEHLENPLKALREVKRVTKKYAVFSAPNEPFFRAANFIRAKNLTRLGNDIDHINHWSSKSFKKFIGSEFKVLSVRKPFPTSIILAEKLT